MEPQQRRTISHEYAEMNRLLHAAQANYGAGAASMAHHAVKIATDNHLTVILDFGCGKGTLKPAIAEMAPALHVLEYDPAVPGKDTLPATTPDLITVYDVMEHIEPAYLTAVLETLHGLKPKAVHMTIALTPAKRTLPDGRNAHLIVQPAEWWLAELERYFMPLNTQVTPFHLSFVGAPLEGDVPRG